MLSRMDYETLVPGTDEVIAYALIPLNELMAVGRQVRGTLLKNHPLIDRQGSSAYDDYILTGYEEVKVADGSGHKMVRADFARDYSAVSDPVLTVPLKESHGWPPVLGSLTLLGNVTEELVGGDGSSYIWDIAADYPAIGVGWTRDAYRGPTKFEVRTYLTNSPRAVTNPAPVMYGRSIHFDRRVASVSVPPCLHATVTLPDLTVVDGATTLGSYPEVVYAATGQTDWAEHEVSAIPKLVHGVWVTEVTVALVPAV